ncbi:MAG: hypothetical protein ACE5HB_06785 [Terriglobia bacterium]
MKRALILAAVLLVASASALAQRGDYLTREEVDKVRDTQEPNKRIQLFLEIAGGRLGQFEKSLGAPGGEPAAHHDVLLDRLNDFINAIDDTAGNLEFALERGGVDLHKTRKKLLKQTENFLARLDRIREGHEIVRREFPYDMEDALEATHDLVELAKQIPEEIIPPKVPGVSAADAADPGTKPAQPGRPTLRRPSDDKKKKKKDKDDN